MTQSARSFAATLSSSPNDRLVGLQRRQAGDTRTNPATSPRSCSVTSAPGARQASFRLSVRPFFCHGPRGVCRFRNKTPACEAVAQSLGVGLLYCLRARTRIALGRARIAFG